MINAFVRNVETSVYEKNDPPVPEADVQYIMDNMRAVDVFEGEAIGIDRSASLLPTAQLSRLTIISRYRGKPAFICGILEVIPGVFSIWGYGTNHAKKVLPVLGVIARNHARRWLFDELKAQRVQVTLPNDPICESNIRWLRDLDLKPESVARCATVHGGDLLTLAYTVKDHEQYVSLRTSGRQQADDCAGSSAAS